MESIHPRGEKCVSNIQCTRGRQNHYDEKNSLGRKGLHYIQFRKLYRLENKSVDEWMGRLHVVVAECNYRELDRQLKEYFIHGLNDKLMLD